MRLAADLGPPIEIRDFAYPETSPLHYGRPLDRRASEISLSSSEFTGRHARALYDFVPETEYEIGMKAGEVVWVQYRQCPVSWKNERRARQWSSSLTSP